jgi:hypothetical protein
MDRSKVIAIITGAIALILSIAYLLVVQILDFRGEMLPAPTDLSVLSSPVLHSFAGEWSAGQD